MSSYKHCSQETHTLPPDRPQTPGAAPVTALSGFGGPGALSEAVAGRPILILKTQNAWFPVLR